MVFSSFTGIIGHTRDRACLEQMMRKAGAQLQDSMTQPAGDEAVRRRHARLASTTAYCTAPCIMHWWMSVNMCLREVELIAAARAGACASMGRAGTNSHMWKPHRPSQVCPLPVQQFCLYFFLRGMRLRLSSSILLHPSLPSPALPYPAFSRLILLLPYPTSPYVFLTIATPRQY